MLSASRWLMKPALPESISGVLLRHPVLVRLSEALDRVAGIRMVAMLPEQVGWKQVGVGQADGRPEFCRLFQATPEGSRRCRMCHILMAVAASSEGLGERRCHAGPSVLVIPAAPAHAEDCAVISTCMFTTGDREAIWAETCRSGRALGLDVPRLRAAFEAVPEVAAGQLEVVRALLSAAAEAIVEIRARHRLEDRFRAALSRSDPAARIKTALTQAWQAAPGRRPPWPRAGVSGAAREERYPPLIRTVARLVRRQPQMPYSVAAITAAARLTPNYFSALFRRWTGRHFLSFLNAQRIAAAKSLLRDPSLNINEVAYRVGFEDANYFSSRFRRATGMSPHIWRARR